MKKTWLYAVLGGVLGAAVIVHWPRNQRTFDIPPALSATQLAALPTYQVVDQATSELRWSLVDVAPEGMRARVEAMPEPARHVLALSWVLMDSGPGSPPVFTGFADLLRLTAPNAPTLTGVATAFRAIGAEAAAAVVEEAARQVASSGWTPDAPADKDPFQAVNRKLNSVLTDGGAARQLRAYVIAHLAEIASVRAGP